MNINTRAGDPVYESDVAVYATDWDFSAHGDPADEWEAGTALGDAARDPRVRAAVAKWKEGLAHGASRS